MFKGECFFVLCLIKKNQRVLLFKGDTIKADEYVPMLKNWSQMDFAPPHLTLVIRNFLNDKLLNKLISELWIQMTPSSTGHPDHKTLPH